MVSSFHHIGCLVSSIQAAINDYLILYPAGTVSEIYDMQDQKIRVCFFSIGSTNIEFVAPEPENLTLLRLLNKNPGFYHIGLYTSDMDDEIVRLEDNVYMKISRFRSKAFNDRWCAFLYNNEMHLIELIEAE